MTFHSSRYLLLIAWFSADLCYYISVFDTQRMGGHRRGPGIGRCWWTYIWPSGNTRTVRFTIGTVPVVVCSALLPCTRTTGEKTLQQCSVHTSVLLSASAKTKERQVQSISVWVRTAMNGRFTFAVVYVTSRGSPKGSACRRASASEQLPTFQRTE